MLKKILLYLCFVVVSTASASSLRLGGGFLSGNASNAPGLFGGYEKGFESSPFSWGVESGLFFQSGPSAVSLPLQAALYYRFKQVGPGIIPTIGFSAGALASFGGGTRPIDPLFFVHPAVEFSVSENLNGFFRMSVGGKGVVFQFAPLLGVFWDLDS